MKYDTRHGGPMIQVEQTATIPEVSIHYYTGHYYTGEIEAYAERM